MCQRDEPECPGAHTKWELPGGKVDIGEVACQAVEREIKEETNIECRAIKLLQYNHHSLWQYDEHQKSVLIFSYLCDYIGGDIRNSDKRVMQVKWQSIDIALKLESLPGTKEVIKEVAQEVEGLVYE